MPTFDLHRAVEQFVAESPALVGTHITYRQTSGAQGPIPFFDYEGSKALLLWLLRKAKRHPEAAYLAWNMCEGTRELRRQYRPELVAEDQLLEVLETRARRISQRHFPDLDVRHLPVGSYMEERPCPRSHS